MKKTTFFSLIFLLPYLTLAQPTTIHQLTVKPNASYTLKFTKAFQAISITYHSEQSLVKTTVIANNQEFSLQKNTHTHHPNQQFSQLLVFEKSIQSFRLESGQLNGKIEIHLYHLGDTKTIQQRVKAYRAKFRTTQTCDKPVSVPQSIWRAGLTPEPIPDPVVTDVKHLIIHHSVSSNTATDQVAILRAIYLFHRVTRGWNDIAYNYLIAPDGTLYEGRDPQGKETEGDNIRGGHFCTRRQDGTMGVCLLGTFVDYEPPLPMLKTLISLLNWKVKKDGMNPFGAFGHPLNNPIVNALPVIAGHQDGCTTQCPGNKVFEKIIDIREKVNADVQVCGGKTDHCAPLRITGSIYTAVYQLKTDFDLALAACKNSGTNCDLFCTGKSFYDQIASLRTQIQHIEQTCQNDSQNCIQPCNSTKLLNQLTAIEQQLNNEIQFWLNNNSTITNEITTLETTINQALSACNVDPDFCEVFYPENTFANRIQTLKNHIDSLKNICQGVTNTSTVNADALLNKLTQLEVNIQQKVDQLSQQNQLTIYPNPVGNGVIWLRSLNTSKITNIRLKNILGKSYPISRILPTASRFVWQVLISRIPSGWYIMEIQIDGKWERRRLILK